MEIVLGCDHGGVELKEWIRERLENEGYVGDGYGNTARSASGLSAGCQDCVKNSAGVARASGIAVLRHGDRDFYGGQ